MTQAVARDPIWFLKMGFDDISRMKAEAAPKMKNDIKPHEKKELTENQKKEDQKMNNRERKAVRRENTPGKVDVTTQLVLPEEVQVQTLFSMTFIMLKNLSLCTGLWVF